MNNFTQQYCIGWLTDKKHLRDSASGGAFFALAQSVLAKGGWVYGTQFTRENGAHVVGYNDERICRFRGSKYVKSDMNGALEKIRSNAENGDTVLFCGTPCQCSAVRKFLKKDYSNVYLADIICHGSPRPHVFEAYLKYLEKKHKSYVTDISFRNKDNGWAAGNIAVTFCDGSVWKQPFHPQKNKYARVFYSNIALTPACNNCRFNTLERTGDLTLGDFWGYRSHPEIQINAQGTSVILVNTEKGEQLLKDSDSFFTATPVSKESAISNNPPLYEHTPIYPLTERFCASVKKHGFLFAYNLYVVIAHKLLLPLRIIRRIIRKK